jgi:hypothetical protein
MTDSPWMDLAEGAAYCGGDMSPETLRRACVAQELLGFQLKRGGKWRVRREHIDAWLMGETAEVVVPRVARGRER